MLYINLFLLFCLLFYVSAFNLHSISNAFHSSVVSLKKIIKRRDVNNQLNSTLCDENKLMLALASLQIVSPERILLLLISDTDSFEICRKMANTLKSIETDQKNCKPLDPENLYMMLVKGLKAAHRQYCGNPDFQKAFIQNIECYGELQEEYIDCEGPADWFENSNESKLCEHVTDIILCDYTKTALLCGTFGAHNIYCISKSIIHATIKTKCDVPEPVVKDAMKQTRAISLAIKNNNSILLQFNCILFCIFIIILFQFI